MQTAELNKKSAKKNKIKRSRWWVGLIFYTLFILICLIFIFPVFMILSKSLMTQRQATMTFPALVFPTGKLHFENYASFFKLFGYTSSGVPYVVNYFFNTLIVVVLSTVGVVFSATLVAFGFCKMKFKGRNAVFMIVLATMMIPSAVTMVPLYVIFAKLQWTNSTLPLWIPMWFGGGALNIFLVKQYMMTLPNEISESARIDGAGYFRQYFSIILPNCIPIMIVIAIGSITGAWNDLQGPLTYISSSEKYTLTLAVSMLSTDSSLAGNNTPATMAACMLLLIPPFALFIGGQKYFIESVVMSGVKG